MCEVLQEHKNNVFDEICGEIIFHGPDKRKSGSSLSKGIKICLLLFNLSKVFRKDIGIGYIEINTK